MSDFDQLEGERSKVVGVPKSGSLIWESGTLHFLTFRAQLPCCPG
jgi:hypothetical protein